MAALGLRPAALLALGCLGALVLGCGATDSSTVPLSEGGGVWSPSGASIARERHGGIEIERSNGTDPRLIPTPKAYLRLGWSGDGRQLLFMSKGPGGLGRPLERVNAIFAHGGARPSSAPLALHAGSDGWSPRGWPMAFTTTPFYFDVERGPVGPEPALWILAGLRSAPERILDLPGAEAEPRFSPDGKTIMFTVNGSSVWRVQRDGSQPRRLAAGLSGANASWSPNGRWVAIAATAAGGDRRSHLYLVPSDGGRVRQLATEELRAGEAPAWTPDGGWITYATFDGEVRSVHTDGSGAKTIANFPNQEVRHLSWSPDGRRLAYTASPIVESD